MRIRRWPVPAAAMLLGSVIAAAAANWPPLVGQRLFQAAEDAVSARVAAWLTAVRPLGGAGAPRRAPWPPPGRFAAYEPLELVRLRQSGADLPAGAFTVLANTPAAYQWRPVQYQLWLLEASTEAAAALGIDAVVDASAADALRLTARGRKTVEELRKAGILRAVVFDGGHHLPGLALAPEIAFLPVLDVDGIAYACHARSADAVAIPALRRLARARGIRTAFYTTPRFVTMAKTKRAMAILLAKAFRRPSPPAGETCPAEPAGPLLLRKNAYQLLLAAATGWLRRLGRRIGALAAPPGAVSPRWPSLTGGRRAGAGRRPRVGALPGRQVSGAGQLHIINPRSPQLWPPAQADPRGAASLMFGSSLPDFRAIAGEVVAAWPY